MVWCEKGKFPSHVTVIIAVFALSGSSLKHGLDKWTTVHDSSEWFVESHFFTSALENGILLLWNPYNQGGTPFSSAQAYGLIEPLYLLLILLKQAFHANSLDTYLFNYCGRYFIFLMGAYLAFCHFNPHRWLNFVFTLYLELSNFGNMMIQNGTIHSSYFIPLLTFSF